MQKLTDNGGLEVNEDSAGHVLAGAGLAEEGVEGVVTPTDGLVGGHLAVRLDTVLQTVQLPAGIADLDSGLSHVDGDDFTYLRNKRSTLFYKMWGFFHNNINCIPLYYVKSRHE